MAPQLFHTALLLMSSIVPASVIAGTITCPADFSDSGQATFYTGSDLGACSLPVDEGFRVAINSAQYDGSAHCGECLLLTGPSGSVVATIADECPTCPAGNLDLNPATWDAVTDQASGFVDITWKRVPCPLSGNVLFEFEGSNPFFLKIQARDHRYGTSSMAYRDGSSWVSMARTSDNHFVAQDVPNISNATVRLTANTGQTIQADLGKPSQTGLIDSGSQFMFCQEEIFFDRFEQFIK